jgi:predicted NUDIX family phosphoesterase
MPTPEPLFCVPRPAVLSLLAGRRGLIPIPWAELVALAPEARTQPRGDALELPGGHLFEGWVQLVTYGVIGLDGPATAVSPWPDRCFAYRRSGGGETRLEDELSLGVGGHVRVTDGGGTLDAPPPLGRAILGAVARELAEELKVRASRPPRYLGLVFQDERPVEAAHLGVVFLVAVAEPGHLAVRPGQGLEAAGWFERATLLIARRHFEPWSRAVIETMVPAQAAAPGA